MRGLVLFESTMHHGALSHSSQPANYTRVDISDNTQLSGQRRAVIETWLGTVDSDE